MKKNAAKKNPTHGGPRKGAGRPSSILPGAVTRSFVVDADVLEFLTSGLYSSASRVLNEAVRESPQFRLWKGAN